MRSRSIRLLSCVAAGMALAIAAPSHAAQFQVSTLADSGAGSMRDAVAQANAAAGADQIVFTGAATSGTIALASEIAITDELTLTGPGTRALSITSSGRIFNVTSGILNVSLTDLTLENANASGNGGAILGASAGINLDRVALLGNQATGEGGALYCTIGAAPGLLTIRNSTIAGNHANKMGAFAAYGCSVEIENSTISGNTATDSNGAAFLAFSSFELRNSTVFGNSANFVGGIHFQDGSGPMNVVSSIVAENTDQTGINDLNRTGNSTVNASNSLFSEVFVPADNVINGTDTNNLIGVNPLLGPLANNGGPTDTRLPTAASPVIDQGANPNALPYDQRGPGFPRQMLAGVDMGAVEFSV
ncbi:MAG: choice-of-anchor Q domain-containing protein, partial [Thermoanaerobaculia bacterium]